MVKRLKCIRRHFSWRLPVAGCVKVSRAIVHRIYWFIYWLRVRKIDWTSKICGFPVLVSYYSNVTIAANALIGKNVTIAVASQGKLNLGRRAVLTRDIVIGCNSLISIGNDVLVAEFVSIRDMNHNYNRLDIPIADQGEISSPITICDDVWIGRGSAILGGVTIGKGAIIAANSVVYRDVEPFAIVAGIPARVIKHRQESIDAKEK